MAACSWVCSAMVLSLVTAPAAEPLTVAEVARHLRIDETQQEPAPLAGPTVALAAAGAGNVDNGAHRYGVSFVTADGETPPSPLSSAVTVADKTVDGKVALTAIETGGAAVTSRKLWRTIAGGSTLLFLATLADNTTTTYTDNIADASLGSGAPSTNTTSDPQLLEWIKAARERVEDLTGRALIDTTFDAKQPDWLCDGASDIELPRANLRSVTSVSYVDSNGVTQTLASDQYVVTAPTGPRAARGTIAPAYNVTWPVVRSQPNPITIRFVAGYGATASAVPRAIRQAMLLMIGDWHDLRENTIVGTISSEVPHSAIRLLKPYYSRSRTRESA